MRPNLIIMASAQLAEGSDPITAFMTRDWASAGGWSLAIGLGALVIFGFFREIIVPGTRLQRAEARAEKAEAALALSQEALAEALSQNGKLLGSSDIVAYVLQEVLPGIKAKGGDSS
jgi:hypothetical protein